MLKLPVTETVNNEGQTVISNRVSTGNPLHDELLRLSDALTQAISELEASGRDFATKDNEYRKAKARAIVSSATKGRNAQERESIADELFADKRLAASLAEAVNVANLEKVRGLRAQLSAFQTLVSARKAESDAIGYGQIQRT